MQYKTFDQWKKEGQCVLKGEKSHKRNKNGEAVFNQNQVNYLEYNENQDSFWHDMYIDIHYGD